ncbi:hypothetical protein V2I01_34035 [Micromonospora sp. BRA006-A]|nr:hypothetical protein [Micromonospora sp. BRA006-A]
MIVGTFRDVTAEHYAVQRETALAGLSMRLSQADDLTDALHGVLDELRTRGGPPACSPPSSAACPPPR